MAIKTIIVHLGDDPQVETRIRFATQLAAKHAAFLTGLFVMRDVDMPDAIVGRGASSVVLESRLERIAERANELATIFDDHCGKMGVQHRWVQEDGEHLKLLAEHARAADLLLVSQFDAKGLDNKLRLHIAERLILTAGVPVLVLPFDFDAETDFERVMIAWNSSRESVRAVRDALDLIKAANTVVGLSTGSAEETGRVPLEQLQAFLSRHGVSVEIKRDFGDARNAGDIILRQAADNGINLIVMGAFGRPGWQEIILGGATRQVLENMDRPVLMSH